MPRPKPVYLKRCAVRQRGGPCFRFLTEFIKISAAERLRSAQKNQIAKLLFNRYTAPLIMLPKQNYFINDAVKNPNRIRKD